jgi:hypothetical protein
VVTAFQRGDAVRLTLVRDIDINLGGTDVDVTGERTDDLHRDTALSEHRAERMAESVGRAAIVAHAGGGGVLGDDVADRPSG